MFIMPELVIESVIRDGLSNLRSNLDAVDRVFAQLKQPYLEKKYGQKEINRIRKLIETKQIGVVHNLSDIGANVPTFSIQLGMDVEDQKLAALDDHDAIVEEDITDPQELADLVKVDNVIIQSYTQNSGIAKYALGVDLGEVKKGMILVDGDDQEHEIINVVNTVTTREIHVAKGSLVNIADFTSVKSSISKKTYEEKSIRSDEQILVGIHTKDALTCKYLYILLKFFLNSRKKTLNERCFIVSSFQGSDFTRNMAYQGDQVYNRFYTVTGKIEDSWRDAEGTQVENVEVQTLVPKSEATAKDVGVEGSSVTISSREDFDC